MTMKRRRNIDYLGRVEKAVETESGAEFAVEGGAASVSVYAPGVVRVYATPGHTEVEPDISWAVVAQKPEKAEFNFCETGAGWEIATEEMKVEIDRVAFRVTARDSEGGVLCEDAKWGGVGSRGRRVNCDKVIAGDEHFYGFGEKAFTTDRRGKKMVMWNTDAANHQWDGDPLYIAVPFFVGLRGGRAYGIFFDSTWKSFFDMGGISRQYYTFGAEGGPVNYYIIAGPGIKDVIRRYTDLTGRGSLPPLWALGYHQSRWSYKNEKKVMSVADKMRKHDIPCDVIHLDIHYMQGYRVFTWNPRRFPDPAGMMKKLAGDGFRVVTIVDPGVKIDPGYNIYEEGRENDMFCRESGGRLFTGIVWPGETHFPDFAREDVREWWASHVERFMNVSGQAGIWNDMNEPSINIKPHMRRIRTDDLYHEEKGRRVPHLKLRNAYGLQEAMATYDGILRARPGRRPFILTRSGYAGIQRYAAAWTGDNTSSWDHMRLSIPMLCGLGASGVPFAGADIGGFAGMCSGEMYARWVQLGVFYPFCRTHTMMLSRAQQPWSFGRRVLRIVRDHIRLRYRLMPYLYNAFHENTVSGAPVMRSMALEFQDDEKCCVMDDQFMFGGDLMIAPVMEKGARGRDVYLPRGDWFDFHTGAKYTGGRTIEAAAPLDVVPIYARAGSIVPMAPVARCAGEYRADPLLLHVYTAGGAALNLYEDDGDSYPAGEDCAITEFRLDVSGPRMTLAGSTEITGKPRGIPHRKNITVFFYMIERYPKKVTQNGETLHEAWLEELPGESPFHGWLWDREKKVLAVGFKNSGGDFQLDVDF